MMFFKQTKTAGYKMFTSYYTDGGLWKFKSV